MTYVPTSGQTNTSIKNYVLSLWGTQDQPAYILVVGDKEVGAHSVAVRSRAKGDEGACPVEAFIARILAEIAEKK